MTNLRTLMLLFAGLGATALAGCGANVPENPSWQDDVYPIMVARCVRCHNAQESPDPLSPGNPVGNFDHASFDDFNSTDKLFFVAAPAYITSDAATRMPLPPAAKLTDWQIQTIKNFITANGLAPSQ